MILTRVDAFDARRGDALLSRRANDGARAVHGGTLILTRGLTISTATTVHRIDDGNELLLIGTNLEVDFAVAQREEREILPGSHAVARVKLYSAVYENALTHHTSVKERRNTHYNHDMTSHARAMRP